LVYYFWSYVVAYLINYSKLSGGADAEEEGAEEEGTEEEGTEEVDIEEEDGEVVDI
jgi:hypothetical protein